MVEPISVDLTESKAIHPLALAHEAIELAHLLKSQLGPALLRQDGLDFLAQGNGVLGVGG